MKQLPVGNNGHFASVDDEDYDFLAPYKWSVKPGKGTRYAHTNVQSDDGSWVNVGMHRMIIGDASQEWTVPVRQVSLTTGKVLFVINEGFHNVRKMSVDHIDGNGLNNCRSNLRHATCAEQTANRRLR